MNIPDCVVCGGPNAVTMSNIGPICRQCQDRINAELRRQILEEGRIVTQAIDPDAPPMRCTVKSCTNDATLVMMCAATDDLVAHLASCDEHTDLMVELFGELRSGQSFINLDAPEEDAPPGIEPA